VVLKLFGQDDPTRDGRGMYATSPPVTRRSHGTHEQRCHECRFHRLHSLAVGDVENNYNARVSGAGGTGGLGPVPVVVTP
jgi:hypothetical protein